MHSTHKTAIRVHKKCTKNDLLKTPSTIPKSKIVDKGGL